MSERDFAAYLSENPRMIGVLFTLTMLLAGAGNAAAAGVHTLSGP